MSLRILLDECVSPKVARELLPVLPSGSFCDHVRRAGLAGLPDDQLQDAALSAGYSAMITTDMQMEQQTPARLPVIVVPANSNIERIAPYLPEVVEHLAKPLSAAYYAIPPHTGTPEWKRSRARLHRQRPGLSR